MFHHPPVLPYKGLTIILSNASRFDTRQLLSGNAGDWFCNNLLQKVVGCNRYSCDIYDVEGFNSVSRTLREGTKVLLLLGERAHQSITGLDTSLGEHRGSPTFKRIASIASYLPQDAFDPTNHEARLNAAASGYEEDNDSDDDEDDSDIKSRHGRTKRSNYRFWLGKDMEKVGRILRNNGELIAHHKPDYCIYPSAKDAIDCLNSYENTDFYFDIENDTEYNVNCFGFSFGDDNPVFTLPMLRWDYSIAYQNIGEIVRALVKAMSKNTTIAHNGSGHDFIIMPWKYGIPWGSRLADTMIMAHRCFPMVEKSLGHVISLFTDLPYHKDEGVFMPQNTQQEQQLWQYNAKDVYAMREVKKGIVAYARTQPGLVESIQQANNSLVPYLTTVLQGLHYDEKKVEENLVTNDRILNGLLRLLSSAVGIDKLEEIRGNGESSMPSSSPQCCRYFHDYCGYPVQGYGKVGKNGKRNPSLNEKNFLKLIMKLEDKGIKNPVIDIVLGYRTIAKESSMLRFEPWTGVKQLRSNNI